MTLFLLRISLAFATAAILVETLSLNENTEVLLALLTGAVIALSLSKED